MLWIDIAESKYPAQDSSDAASDVCNRKNSLLIIPLYLLLNKYHSEEDFQIVLLTLKPKSCGLQISFPLKVFSALCYFKESSKVVTW